MNPIADTLRVTQTTYGITPEQAEQAVANQKAYEAETLAGCQMVMRPDGAIDVVPFAPGDWVTLDSDGRAVVIKADQHARDDDAA